MNDTVNRQILLVEKPTGKLATSHFKLVELKKFSLLRHRGQTLFISWQVENRRLRKLWRGLVGSLCDWRRHRWMFR